MRKSFLIIACVIGFMCAIFLAIHFSDKILDIVTSEIPSMSVDDANRNGKFIAKLEINQKSFTQGENKYYIEEAWIEPGFRLNYKFPFDWHIERSGYNYCFKVLSGPKKLSIFRGRPKFIIGDQDEFGILRPSIANKSLFFTNLSSLKAGNFRLICLKRDDPEHPMVSKIGINYFDAAFNAQKKANYSQTETTEKNWYAYNVVDDKGFNPFFTPFEYRCDSGHQDILQRLTFPVLLSMKFDFLKNNICTRHPAFIFLRDLETQKSSASDPEKAIMKMKEWGMNVVVSGTIVQHGDLYSGSMIIFNENGKLFEKEFEKTGYFKLMGAMISAWMTESGESISDRLKAELCRPMTNSNQALRLLGQSFKLKHRSAEQWKLYEKILEIDPDFAELRWWYANQKWWQNNDDEWNSKMLLKALESHLVVTAMTELRCSTSDGSKKQCDRFFENTRKIIPDHWIIPAIKYQDKWNVMSHSEVVNLGKDAIKMPYAYFFSSHAAERLYYYGDYQYSIPLMLSILNSKFNPGRSTLPEYNRLVYSFLEIGYLRDATALTNLMFQYTNDKSWAAIFAGHSQDEALNYPLAIELYKLALKEDKTKERALNFLINAYLESNRISEVEKIMSSKQWLDVPDELKLVFGGLASIKKGDFVKGRALLSDAKIKIGNHNGYYRRFLESALVEEGCKRKSDCGKRFRDQFWKYSPKKRWSYSYHPVDNLWLQSPRSRKTYLWYKKVYSGDVERLRDYLYVAIHLFPNQMFWQEEYQSLPKGIEPNEKELVDRFEYLKSARLMPSLVSGFRVEYICLRLMNENPVLHREKVIEFYQGYANQKNVSREQSIHRKTFLALIEHR
jgi:hypothetical protein